MVSTAPHYYDALLREPSFICHCTVLPISMSKHISSVGEAPNAYIRKPSRTEQISHANRSLKLLIIVVVVDESRRRLILSFEPILGKPRVMVMFP